MSDQHSKSGALGVGLSVAAGLGVGSAVRIVQGSARGRTGVIQHVWIKGPRGLVDVRLTLPLPNTPSGRRVVQVYMHQLRDWNETDLRMIKGGKARARALHLPAPSLRPAPAAAPAPLRLV